MCHSKELNHKINRLHERGLRVVYKDSGLTFEELIEKDKSFTIHERNLQKLATEMYKVKHNLCPKPIQDIFTKTIRGKSEWVLPRVRTVNRGIETKRYRGPLTWESVPEDIKNSASLELFKERIKN